jgi:hypothetical protein
MKIWGSRIITIAVVSTPLKVTGLFTVSFVSPETFWTVGCTLCTLVATYLHATVAAYVYDQSTNVKPSWVISLVWEAFLNCVRRVLSPDGTIGEALVVVVLAVVLAVPLFTEVWVLKCVDMGDMDMLS